MYLMVIIGAGQWIQFSITLWYNIYHDIRIYHNTFSGKLIEKLLMDKITRQEFLLLPNPAN